MRLSLMSLILPALALFAGSSLWAQPTPADDPIEIFSPTTTTGGVSPAIAGNDRGDFVVTWRILSSPPSYESEVRARMFNRRGEAVGSPLLIQASGAPSIAQVAISRAGRSVITWQDSPGPCCIESVVRAQRYVAAAPRPSPPFFVAQDTSSLHEWPSVAMDATGNFVVVWNEESRGQFVSAQRFARNGKRVGPEFPVSVAPLFQATDPSIAMGDSGGFAVFWQSFPGLVGRVFDHRGQAVSDEFDAPEFGTDPYQRPFHQRVAMDGEGNFVVVATTYGLDGSGLGVTGQRFDRQGIPAAPAFQVNTDTAGDQFLSSISMNSSGEFVVVWSSPSGGFTSSNQAQFYDPSGSRVGPAFSVGKSGYDMPSAAVDGEGNVVVASSLPGDHGWNQPIIAYRFISPHLLALASPRGFETLDCRDPVNSQPTIRWASGEFDRFRAIVSLDERLRSDRSITSGAALVETTEWTPSPQQWYYVCDRLKPQGSSGAGVYIRVDGVDLDASRNSPRRRMSTEPRFIRLRF